MTILKIKSSRAADWVVPWHLGEMSSKDELKPIRWDEFIAVFGQFSPGGNGVTPKSLFSSGKPTWINRTIASQDDVTVKKAKRKAEDLREDTESVRSGSGQRKRNKYPENEGSGGNWTSTV